MKLKATKLLYRIDGRSPSRIMHKCPITFEEAENIKNLRERGQWTFLAGVNDEDMRGFKLNREKATTKLKETRYRIDD